VTNVHVIQGARRIRVQLPISERAARQSQSIMKPAGTVLDAKIVGLDRETDVAVLKIEATELPHLTLGDSRELRRLPQPAAETRRCQPRLLTGKMHSVIATC
jgi:S1-C subfamily serine protease